MKRTPIKKTLYECPICNNYSSDNEEDITRHMEVPLSRGVIIPKGFTFGERRKYSSEDFPGVKDYIINVIKYGNRIRDWIISSGERWMHHHDFEYGMMNFAHNLSREDHPEIDQWDLMCGGPLYSVGWIGNNNKSMSVHLGSFEFSRFSDGQYFLLTEEQFQYFLDKRQESNPELNIPKNQLRRTVEGIEKLLT